MYRPVAMSALGPDRLLDAVDCMAKARGHKDYGKPAKMFVVRWRKAAGMLYYQQRPDGRYAILRNGKRVINELYSTLAGVRGRIAWEAKRAKEIAR